MVETLEDGTGNGEAGELLEDFVDEVARIEVGGDQDVGLAGDLVGFGVGQRLTFVETDARIDGSVKLHFSSDEDIAVRERRQSFLDEVDSRVFAAAAESGEREHGDARVVGEKFFGGSVGLLDDFVELVRSGVLTSGHVGEEIKFVVAAHDDETGESLVGL